jgi:hypothetical protein
MNLADPAFAEQAAQFVLAKHCRAISHGGHCLPD